MFACFDIIKQAVYKGLLFERVERIIMDARTALEVLMWTLGPLVMLTYVWMYYVMSAYTYEKRSRPWALFGDNGPYFGVWAASVLVCVISFLHLSVWLCYFYGGTELQTYDWLLYPYGLFLCFSALYAPLLVLASPSVVMVDLICAAASAIAMFAWTALYLTSSVEGIATCVLTAWLALHCTVLDAGLWGYTWYYQQGYWAEDGTWQQVPPSDA